MLKLSIVKVESPSCLWGRVVQGPGGDTETTDHYNSLLAQMNLFYQDLTQDLLKLKPTSIHRGQVCVVYWAIIHSWCRAMVESVIEDSVSCRARCLLVDHGERLVIPSEQIRVAMQNFLKLPFLVKKFHLAGIKPTTLRVSVAEIKAKLVPSGQWDSSATLYLHNLLQVSTQTEAVLVESESDSTSIELYLTLCNIKVCMNDELVAKKFAYYSKESSDIEDLNEVDRAPFMLDPSALTQVVYTASLRQTTSSPPPSESTVMSESETASAAADWPTAPSQARTQQNEFVTAEVVRRSNFTQQLPENSQWGTGFGATAGESDSSEDIDSSLAAPSKMDRCLFRLQKFLNPDSSYQQAAPTEALNEELKDFGPEEMAAMDVCVEQGILVESESAEKTCKRAEDLVCSRLLEWLNPEPLSSDRDEAESGLCQSNPRRREIIVHSALPVEPCISLEDVPITKALHWVLRKKQYNALSAADCYSWPALARGSNTLIISPQAEAPLSYLTPLLSHILLNSIFTAASSSSGPIVVVLCPGWEKVQVVFDLLEESRVAQSLHPATLVLGVNADEAKTANIPKNSFVLVTTPFTFERLLSSHCFLFLRLSHLLLDEADKLFTLAPDQMATILQHFQRVTTSEDKQSCPQQLVAVARRWTSHMEDLLVNHMPHPCIVITVPEEAAVYGNVKQITLMTLESNKISVLLSTINFNPDRGQKTLIVTNSVQEVEDVFKVVSHNSAFCLKTHEGLLHHFDIVVQQWKKAIGPGTQVVLVTTNECLKYLGVRDATCVIHYGFPSSPKLFGTRLFCMAENFRNLSERVCFQDQKERQSPDIRSVLLITEKNARHMLGLLRYLERTNNPLPPELLSFGQGVHMAREVQKKDRPLCFYLKSFGVCRDSSVCPDRHTFIAELDQSQLPASGVIEVLPLHVKTASVLYGRLITKDRDFDNMASEMISYYADKKPGAKELLEGGLYAVQEEEVYHRVKILSMPDRGDRLFFRLFVRFIDVGKEEEVKSHQILQLPVEFQSLPAQAVEFIVCRVKPADVETNWHPKVTRAISQKIRGLQHRARAVLSLGNTIFVDPMVRVTKVPGLKTPINEHNVQSDILNSGMAVNNPEHVDLLRSMCQKGVGGTEEYPPSEEGKFLLFAADGIKAEEEVLAEAFRVAELKKGLSSDAPLLKSSEYLNSSDSNQSGMTVNGCFSRADLQLHENIKSTSCSLEMKSNEPVLKLVKQKTYLGNLVKNKINFVKYDMEHFEGNEDRSPNGHADFMPLFSMKDAGETQNCYVNSESDSDSD